MKDPKQQNNDNVYNSEDNPTGDMSNRQDGYMAEDYDADRADDILPDDYPIPDGNS